MMKRTIMGLLCGFILLGLCMSILHAEEPLVILTDPWPPYVFEKGSKIKGLDCDITEAVFRQLKIPIQIEFYPWKRCLMMMQHKRADALLDAMITEERKSFLFFAEEELSHSPLVLFYKKAKPVTFNVLDELKTYRIGILLGYDYPEKIRDILVKTEAVSKLKQNLLKLKAERVDCVIANKTVTLYEIQRLGLEGQIAMHPKVLAVTGANHLAFAKKPGYDQLAVRFSNALKGFKATEEYHVILRKYGQE